MKYILLRLLALCSCSCSDNINRKKTKEIIKEWVGKTIIIPKIPKTSIISLSSDTIYPDNNSSYKILLYMDSMGCSACRLRTYNWKKVFEDANLISSDILSFEFYFHPKNERELLFVLRGSEFNYPVIHIDRENKLNKLNQFSLDINYQCFLLDKENKVILVGNPFTNPSIWSLYKKIITREISEPLATITEANRNRVKQSPNGKKAKFHLLSKK